MDLDVSTLRVAFVIAALSMALLFYFVTYRTTGSRYSLWWSISLLAFLAGSSAYLLNGTDHQWWANPAGNALIVLGAGLGWVAARSLRVPANAARLLAIPVLVTLFFSAIDDPATNIWAGGAVFLAATATMFGLSASELLRFHRRGSATPAVWMGIVAVILCLYYLGRCITFLIQGYQGAIFDRFFGSAITTLFSLVFMVAVSFTMTELANDQATRDLRRRATHDSMTGLLNRDEFDRLALRLIASMRRSGRQGVLILADIDGFKDVNDTYGHQVGDQVLRRFAAGCREVVRSSDLLARYGGEEFVILLRDAHLDDAEEVTTRISSILRAAEVSETAMMPTISYGLVELRPDRSLAETIRLADEALYEAKRAGRDRTVRAP